MSEKENIIASVLEMPNDKRSDKDIELLVVLIKHLEFFKERNIREKHYPEIVACLKLQQYKNGEIVFNKGDEGKLFFVIIKGTVSVLLPNVEK